MDPCLVVKCKSRRFRPVCPMCHAKMKKKLEYLNTYTYSIFIKTNIFIHNSPYKSKTINSKPTLMVMSMSTLCVNFFLRILGIERHASTAAKRVEYNGMRNHMHM